MLKSVSDDAVARMNSTCETFKQDLKGLRTGRANPAILDGIVVNVYNNNVRLNQIATVSVINNKMLNVSVWDLSNAETVNKAIANSNLGLNPILEGSTIRIPLPELSEQRRKELVKVARDYSERSKVAIRNVRRDAIGTLKDMNKNKEISEDELHKATEEIQKIISDNESNIDKLLQVKEAEILQS